MQFFQYFLQMIVGQLLKSHQKSKKIHPEKVSHIFPKKTLPTFQNDCWSSCKIKKNNTLGWLLMKHKLIKFLYSGGLLIKHRIKTFFITRDECWFSIPSQISKSKCKITTFISHLASPCFSSLCSTLNKADFLNENSFL